MATLLGALDIGTQTTRLLAGELSADRKLRITACTQTPTAGIKKGIIRDIAAVADGIQKVQADMSSRYHTDIYSVMVSLSSGEVRAEPRTGAISLLRGHAIDSDDMAQAEESAETEERHDATEQVLQRLKQNFEVNGQFVDNPLGMTGAELKANVLEFVAPRTTLDNIRTAVRNAGLKEEGIVFSGLASALAVSDATLRNDGMIAVDIGAGTVNYMAFTRGQALAAGSLALGGTHLTNDLMRAFQVDRKAAEAILFAKGAALIQPDSATSRYALRTTLFAPEKTLSVHAIQTVTTERLDEMLRVTRDALSRQMNLQQFNGRLILTGGVAAMPHLCEKAADIFGLPCELGVPVGAEIQPEAMLESPYKFATGIGLLHWGVRMQGQSAESVSSWKKFCNFFKG